MLGLGSRDLFNAEKCTHDRGTVAKDNTPYWVSGLTALTASIYTLVSSAS